MSSHLPPPPPPPSPIEQIENLLHRRTDLSTFLVHFIRDYAGLSAKENLISILHSHNIEARNPYGIMRQLAQTNAQVLLSQLCICFTETPLEHAWMMCRSIANRQHQFGPYGLAFTKARARAVGANPVWYLDQTPGSHEWLTRALDELSTVSRNSP
jgi:hypothetical protein